MHRDLLSRTSIDIDTLQRPQLFDLLLSRCAVLRVRFSSAILSLYSLFFFLFPCVRAWSYSFRSFSSSASYSDKFETKSWRRSYVFQTRSGVSERPVNEDSLSAWGGHEPQECVDEPIAVQLCRGDAAKGEQSRSTIGLQDLSRDADRLSTPAVSGVTMVCGNR